MVFRRYLLPKLTEYWLSQDRLLKARGHAERVRRYRGIPHQISYFHQVDDPYSGLLAQCLGALVQRYAVELVPHVVGPPSDAAAPDRDRLVAYSRADAQRLSKHWGLAFEDPLAQPPPDAVVSVQAALISGIKQGHFIELASALSRKIWRLNELDEGDPARGLPKVSRTEVEAHMASASALRRRLGHYLGGMLYYGGEWYWGIDRLHYLEARLQALGVQRAGVTGSLFPPQAELTHTSLLEDPPTVDFFFSLRSPYSAIAAPRIFELGRLTGAQVRLRPVMPMVMRGLPVPREKRVYISLDAAREARLRQVPFGRLIDPVGRPVERGLALIPLAESLGYGQAYVLSFMQAVWSEGIDAGSDRGLRHIAERAGLAWPDAQAALQDDQWRGTAEANRKALLELGLWGVPAFRVGKTAVWGQDRLWVVQQALCESKTVSEGMSR